MLGTSEDVGASMAQNSVRVAGLQNNFQKVVLLLDEATQSALDMVERCILLVQLSVDNLLRCSEEKRQQATMKARTDKLAEEWQGCSKLIKEVEALLEESERFG